MHVMQTLVCFMKEANAKDDIQYIYIFFRLELIPPREGSATWILPLHFIRSLVCSFFNRKDLICLAVSCLPITSSVAFDCGVH